MRSYLNDSYYRKGLLASDTLYDAFGRKFTETVNHYRLWDVANQKESVDPASTIASVFPQLYRTENFFFEGADVAGKSTTTSFTYDAYGNVETFVDYGEPGTSTDDVRAAIVYDYRPAGWIMNRAQTITVTGGDGKTYRKREGVYDTLGNLRQHKGQIKNGKVAITDLTYDEYGNVKTVTGPENHAGKNYSLTYN